jgi:glycine cleavage system aminomethyltransferase T
LADLVRIPRGQLYDLLHDYEYHAIRNAAALIDVSPLFKYDVRAAKTP